MRDNLRLDYHNSAGIWWRLWPPLSTVRLQVSLPYSNPLYTVLASYVGIPVCTFTANINICWSKPDLRSEVHFISLLLPVMTHEGIVNSRQDYQPSHAKKRTIKTMMCSVMYVGERRLVGCSKNSKRCDLLSVWPQADTTNTDHQKASN